MKKILSVISGLLLISCSTVLAAAVDQTRRHESPPELSEQTRDVPDGYQRRQEVVKADRQGDGFTIQEGYEGFMVPQLTGGTAATVLATTLPTAIVGGLLGLLGLSAIKTNKIMKLFWPFRLLRPFRPLRPLRPFKPFRPFPLMGLKPILLYAALKNFLKHHPAVKPILLLKLLKKFLKLKPGAAGPAGVKPTGATSPGVKPILLYQVLTKLMKPGMNKLKNSVFLKKLLSKLRPVNIQPMIKPVKMDIVPIPLVAAAAAQQPVTNAPTQLQVQVVQGSNLSGLLREDDDTEGSDPLKTAKPEDNEARSSDEAFSHRMAALAAEVLDKIEQFAQQYKD